MIDMSVFAEAIEEQLNAGMAILDTENLIYRFRVYVDGGEYRDFDYLNPNGSISIEQTNRIVRYINCEFDTTGSRSEGVLSVEMSFTARLQVMIPLINTGRGKKKLELVTKIRQIMDDTFRINSTNSYEVDGTTYTYGVLYQLADTGDREKRAEVGDSIILTAFLSYFFVQDGVNSTDFELYLDQMGDAAHQVKFTRLGFNRGCTNESVIPSDSTNGAGKNITTSTVFGLNFDMPLRNGEVDKEIERFLFNGKKTPHSVHIVTPLGAPIEYKMIFSDVSINAETTKFASVTVSMVEAL